MHQTVAHNVRWSTIVLISALGLAVGAPACGGEGSSNTGPAAGSGGSINNTGGTGGSTSGGGTSGSAGAAIGGVSGAGAESNDGGAAGTAGSGGIEENGGSAAGGATTTGGSAGTGGTTTVWPDTYDPNGLPTPSDGNHNAGANCMTCHATGSRIWLFAGTIYQADKTTPAPHVQVLVTDGTNTYTTYSATNGNFWVPASAGSVNWSTAHAHVRNAVGEAAMSGTPAAACNLCHTGTATLTEP